MGSTVLASSLILIIFILIGSNSCLPSSKRNSLDSTQQLAECSEESFCGYVQLNGAGVNLQKSCNCPYGISCPMNWDPFDGRTIHHGYDQYKYCSSAPNLKPCTGTEVAYTNTMEMSLITMETLANSNQLHCLCPRNRIFVRNVTRFLETDDGISVILTEHLCLSSPACGPEDVCMAITESAHSTFVTKKCTCPRGKYCPKDPRIASERVDLDRGAYFAFQCR